MSRNKTISIRTGDNSIVTVERGFTRISEKLDKYFKTNDQFYLENTPKSAIEQVIDYYDEWLGWDSEERQKFADPNSYHEKTKRKIPDHDPDVGIVDLYVYYREMEPAEFFELLKAAHELGITNLVKVLAHITAHKLSGKSINHIEKILNVRK